MRAGCHQTRRPLTICFFIIATLLGNYGVFLCSLLVVKRYVGYTSGGCGRVNMSGTATIFRAVGLFFFFQCLMWCVLKEWHWTLYLFSSINTIQSPVCVGLNLRSHLTPLVKIYLLVSMLVSCDLWLFVFLFFFGYVKFLVFIFNQFTC